jgi:hypothetical protein
MTGIAIHGGITFLGKDPSAANLDLEHFAVDPVNPNPGRVWYNTTEQRIKYAEEPLNEGDPVITRSLPNSVDIATLQSYVDANYSQLATQLNVKPEVQDLAMIIQAVLAMKADAADVAAKADKSVVDQIQVELATKLSSLDVSQMQADISAKANQTDLVALQTEVATKASTSDLVGIQNNLSATQNNLIATQNTVAGKADKATTLAGYGITDALSTSLVGAPNGLPSLDADGKIASQYLNPISITDTFLVETEADMLALPAQQGDIAIRKDLAKTLILRSGAANVAENWEALPTPLDAPVRTVNGMVGDVVVTDIDGNAVTANALTANALSEGREIALTGDVTGSVVFDGSGNVVLESSLAEMILAGTGTMFTVDGKGRIVSYSTPSTLAEYGITDAVSDNDLRLNKIYTKTVSKTPGKGEYASISAAINAIVDAAVDKPYVIRVGAGVYVEPTIVFKPYITVVGAGMESTVIEAAHPNMHLIEGADRASIVALTLTGATGEGYAAIHGINLSSSVEITFNAEHVRFGRNHIQVLSERGYISVNDCKWGSTFAFDYGFVCRNVAGSLARILVRNSTATGLPGGISGIAPKALFLIDGPQSLVFIFGVSSRYSGSQGTEEQVGLWMRNGASVISMSFFLANWKKALWVENVGVGPNINIQGANFGPNDQDIVIDHPGTTGTFNGAARRDTSFVNLDATVSVTYTDPTDQGLVNVGSFYLGRNHSKLVDVSPLITRSLLTGIMEGGSISAGTGLNVNVAGGFGYLRDGVDLMQVSWPNTTVPVQPGLTQYVYVDNSSTIRVAVAIPDGSTNVILGRLLAGASSIIFIGSQGSVSMLDFHTNVDKMLKLTVGPVFVSGSIVTENASMPRAIDVSAGHYFYSTSEVRPIAKTAVGFLAAYSTNGQTSLAMQTQFDNTSYDDGYSLSSLSLGHFNKHVIYTNGNGANVNYLVRIGVGNYATLEEAIAAPLPAPQFNPEGSPMIAAVIVQQGKDNIVQIQDLRPRVGGSTGASSAGASAHGDLLGLTNDDHQQYLLANGTRAMLGHLDMGGYNVTNVALVDGIDVSVHAARHLPNGADPLPTAAPKTSIGSSSINSEGIENKLARSDHSHALDASVWTATNHPTTVAGYGIADAQPLDADLTALAGLSAAGILARTGNGTAAVRTVSGVANEIVVTNGNGVAGNPTIGLAPNLVFQGQEGVVLPSGTSAQRPASPAPGTLRHNSTTGRVENYTTSGWEEMSNVILYQWSAMIGAMTGTTQIPLSTAVPASTGGTIIATSSLFVPSRSDARIRVEFTGFVDSGTSSRNITVMVVRTPKNGNPAVVAVSSTQITAAGNMQQLSLNYVDSAPSPDGCTYDIRLGISGSGTWCLNRGASNTFGNVGGGNVSITEFVTAPRATQIIL